MRRSSIFLIAATLIVVAMPSQAKSKWLPNAKKAIPTASCTTCHTAAGKPALNEIGKFAKANMKGDEPDYEKVAKHAAAAKK